MSVLGHPSPELLLLHWRQVTLPRFPTNSLAGACRPSAPATMYAIEQLNPQILTKAAAADPRALYLGAVSYCGASCVRLTALCCDRHRCGSLSRRDPIHPAHGVAEGRKIGQRSHAVLAGRDRQGWRPEVSHLGDDSSCRPPGAPSPQE